MGLDLASWRIGCRNCMCLGLYSPGFVLSSSLHSSWERYSVIDWTGRWTPTIESNLCARSFAPPQRCTTRLARSHTTKQNRRQDRHNFHTLQADKSSRILVKIRSQINRTTFGCFSGLGLTGERRCRCKIRYEKTRRIRSFSISFGFRIAGSRDEMVDVRVLLLRVVSCWGVAWCACAIESKHDEDDVRIER